MDIPLQVADVRFAARCSLQGNPSQDLLGVIGSGSTVTCVDLWARNRAGLKFAGERASMQCVHRNYREVLRSYLGRIGRCGTTEQSTVYELDMRPECGRTGINAIFGWDVLGDFRVVLDMPSGTGFVERRAGG